MAKKKPKSKASITVTNDGKEIFLNVYFISMTPKDAIELGNRLINEAMKVVQ